MCGSVPTENSKSKSYKRADFRQTDRLIDRQIDRQTAQQTDRLTDQQTFTDNDKSRQKV